MSIFDDNSDEYASEEEVFEEAEEVSSTDTTISDALDEAVARIELANLYRELITAEVFPKNSARESIRNRANEEIKAFALEKLNVLLGISAPKQTSDFSNDELITLKKLAKLDSAQALAVEVMANKMLKRDVPVSAPIQATVPVYKPSISSVTVNEQPKVTAITPKPTPSVQAQPKAATKPKPQKKKEPEPGMSASPDSAFNKTKAIRPKGIKPIPANLTPEQLILSGAIKNSSPEMRDANGNLMQLGASTGNIMSQAINQLTQGTLITQLPQGDEFDVNNKF